MCLLLFYRKKPSWWRRGASKQKSTKNGVDRGMTWSVMISRFPEILLHYIETRKNSLFLNSNFVICKWNFIIEIYVCHMNLDNLTVSCINYSKLLETTNLKVNIEQACFGLFFKVKTIVCNNTTLYCMYLAKNFSPKVHIHVIVYTLFSLCQSWMKYRLVCLGNALVML